LSLQAARESIVLLKNDGVLPLKKDLRSIAVIGPNADDVINQLGDYAPHSVLQEVVTVLGGIRRAVSPQTKVVYARGCDVAKPDKSGFAEAVRAAAVPTWRSSWSARTGARTRARRQTAKASMWRAWTFQAYRRI
jgi:beta-glucosidase